MRERQIDAAIDSIEATVRRIVTADPSLFSPAHSFAVHLERRGDVVAWPFDIGAGRSVPIYASMLPNDADDVAALVLVGRAMVDRASRIWADRMVIHDLIDDVRREVKMLQSALHRKEASARLLSIQCLAKEISDTSDVGLEVDFLLARKDAKVETVTFRAWERTDVRRAFEQLGLINAPASCERPARDYERSQVLTGGRSAT